jgi:hypothetical protein
MTVKEWITKRVQALNEYQGEVEAKTTDLDFEAWRVKKGYIVTEPKQP